MCAIRIVQNVHFEVRCRKALWSQAREALWANYKRTQSNKSCLFCAGLKMALTVDEALEKVGTFGRFQILLLLFSNCLRWVWSGWPILVMTFLSAEPSWRCVANSTVCTLSGAINVGDDDYDKRCNMSRTEWEFSPDFTSVVTEVRCRRVCWLVHTRLT